jgi:hypothetical protein
VRQLRQGKLINTSKIVKTVKLNILLFRFNSFERPNSDKGETERQKDRKTERQKDRKTERQKDRKTERQKDRKTERQKDRFTSSQISRISPTCPTRTTFQTCPYYPI